MPMPTSLAPGYARVTYDGQLFPHHMTIPVNISGTPTPGTEPDLILKDVSTLGAEAAIGALITEILPAFASGINFGLAEIHTVDDTTGEDQFIYSWNLGLSGSSPFAAVPMSQVIMNFKTTLGTAYKLYLLEGVQTPNVKTLPPYGATFFTDIADFVTGAASPVYGRGNAYPFTSVSWISKINYKLRKQAGLA